ncbi:arginine utilization protein RocB [Bryobacterales bacterium F-183]|nr:arginine utilization protein RocB [Bryobacterales bacterium F-183]
MTRDLAIQLTRHRSVTNSPGETFFGPFLQDLLSSWPELSHVEKLRTILGDPYERYNIIALKRSGTPTRRTILLTGHYDVVSTANYGPDLEPLCTDPDLLRPALAAADPALAPDLTTGGFLPGRGLLDMKAGLAAGLTVLRQYEGPGNILFAAVPDEEVASYGMRSLVRQLPDLCAQLGLDIELAINLDAEGDPGDGSRGRAIFWGSVGKLLPLVVFIGRPSHAGAPFDGINPAFLQAEFVRLVDANPELGDTHKGAPAPPVVLYARDTRTHYDVTTPQASYCAVNVLTHTLDAAQVMGKFRNVAAECLRVAIETLERRSGRRMPWAPVVHVLEGLEHLPVEACAAAIQQRAGALGIQGPAAILALASPYYPKVQWQSTDATLADAIKQARDRIVARFGTSITDRPYFPGISDMSFLNAYPTVNIGPWGREYHQRGERVHEQYAFEVLPALLQEVCETVLSREALETPPQSTTPPPAE